MTMNRSIRILRAGLSLTAILYFCSVPHVANAGCTHGNTYNGDPHALIRSVKYPAAVIIEGGRGDPRTGLAGNLDGKKATPLWRLYLCFEKTDQKISNEVNLDFNSLGIPTVRYVRSTEGETLGIGRLNSVRLSYSYSTKLTDDVDQNGVAYGNAEASIRSEQSWEPIMALVNQNLSFNIKSFDTSFSKGRLTGNSITGYDGEGEMDYVMSSLKRFVFQREENRFATIEACERENTPFVLQVGDQITAF